MKNIIIDKIARIIKSRKKLEHELNVKITNNGKEVTIEGEAEDEYFAEKILEALNFGFPFATALLIKSEEYLFEVIKIKDHTRRKDMSVIRARIIGKEGRTLRALNQLTGCFFELKDNVIGIIGDAEYIKNAQESIIFIIRGSKQANVYSYLEKHQIQPVIDLGLKIKEKKEE
jgi:ribosomal RNA assembly protein